MDPGALVALERPLLVVRHDVLAKPGPIVQPYQARAKGCGAQALLLLVSQVRPAPRATPLRRAPGRSCASPTKPLRVVHAPNRYPAARTNPLVGNFRHGSIPKPDQVASAASNVAHRCCRRGWHDPRDAPNAHRDGPAGGLHYRQQRDPENGTRSCSWARSRRHRRYDLRRGCRSRAPREGADKLTVEYGEIRSQPKLGLGDGWGVIPRPSRRSASTQRPAGACTAGARGISPR